MKLGDETKFYIAYILLAIIVAVWIKSEMPTLDPIGLLLLSGFVATPIIASLIALVICAFQWMMPVIQSYREQRTTATLMAVPKPQPRKEVIVMHHKEPKPPAPLTPIEVARTKTELARAMEGQYAAQHNMYFYLYESCKWQKFAREEALDFQRHERTNEVEDKKQEIELARLENELQSVVNPPLASPAPEPPSSNSNDPKKPKASKKPSAIADWENKAKWVDKAVDRLRKQGKSESYIEEFIDDIKTELAQEAIKNL